MKSSTSYVGLDVHKSTISVAIAEDGRSGDIRDYGVIENRADILVKLVGRLGRHGQRLHFCYEAGPCGYGLHRLLSGLGQDCTVVAPSLIPKKAGDRVKTNRRDVAMLARLHRAGELTAVWVPDAAHEAMRDLVRARATAARVQLVRRAGDGRAGVGRDGVHQESGSSAGRRRRLWLPDRNACRSSGQATAVDRAFLGGGHPRTGDNADHQRSLGITPPDRSWHSVHRQG